MRVGIDYRLLSSPENLVNRGIGRYTQQQLRHVLRLDTENEYLLLCPPRADVSLILPDIRKATNVSVCFGPAAADPPAVDPYDRRGLLGRAAAYQDWVHGLGVDLYHATAPFVLEQTAPPAFDACPMVATIYDFIPLLFPSAYLTDARHRAAYAGAARMVTSAARLLAISEATRDDAVRFLGFPAEAIDCASPFADACFRPLPPEQAAATLRSLCTRVTVPDEFILTVAALHHSKNLELLLQAYAMLSQPLRRSLPLVLSCFVNEGGAAYVRRYADRLGIADEVFLTGYVSDHELAALYNRATVVVHPSRYEGFGLPVVEAMQCGAAVVTTTAPSLPQVAGGAAALVDPDDPPGLAAAIDGLRRDPERRRRMGELGVARAAAFTPEALARSTLETYRAALIGGPREKRRARVAVCTPLPSADGEASAHASDLLRVLSSRADVEVFTDDGGGAVPEDILDRWPVHHLSAVTRCDTRDPFDLVVHNIDDDRGIPRPDRERGRAVVVAGSAAGRNRPVEDDAGARVVHAPPGTLDPCAGPPPVESLLARARMGWSAGRFVVLVLDDTEEARHGSRRVLADAVRGRADVFFPYTDPMDDDALLGCDVVVDLCAEERRRVLVRAAAAGKPVIRRGSGEVGLPSSFCDVMAATEDSTEMVARRLAQLAWDPEEVERRSAAARAWFERDANLDDTAPLYLDALGLAARGRSPGSAAGLGFNKLCDVEDLGDPELVDMLVQLGRRPSLGSLSGTLDWSRAMSLRAAAHVGLDRGSHVLSLGANGAPVAFALTRRVGEVTVAVPWVEDGTARSRAMLVDPGLVGGPIDPVRLTVRSAERGRLPFPDALFDAVLACRVVDSVPREEVVDVVEEIVRVTKSGGLVALSFNVRLQGSEGPPPVPLDWILEHVLPATGLEPLDPIREHVSPATLAARRRFSRAFGSAVPGDADPPVTVADGALVGCLHLALRKRGAQPSG